MNFNFILKKKKPESGAVETPDENLGMSFDDNVYLAGGDFDDAAQERGEEKVSDNLVDDYNETNIDHLQLSSNDTQQSIDEYLNLITQESVNDPTNEIPKSLDLDNVDTYIAAVCNELLFNKENFDKLCLSVSENMMNSILSTRLPISTTNKVTSPYIQQIMTLVRPIIEENLTSHIKGFFDGK